MKKKIIRISAITFILINIVLLIVDDGKIDRISHVKEWTEPITMDMKEQMEKDAIISGRENPLYFDKTVGSFQQFLVEEGDRVNVSDPLYTYMVNDFHTTWQNISNNIEMLDQEISSLESIIMEMESYTIPSTNSSSSSTFSVDNTEYELNLPDDQTASIQSELQKQQFILEKEKELAEKNAERDRLENQLVELETTGDTITITSPYEGVVSHLAYSLEDPFLTIMDDSLYVEAELMEEERQQVTEGMDAEILMEETGEVWEGSVTKVHEAPESLSVNKHSIYPVDIEFNEDQTLEEVLPGYHVDLNITLKESLSAVVVEEEQIDEYSVWIMQSNGIMERQLIEQGIKSDDFVEVVTGLSEEQVIAYGDFSQFRNLTPFTTPLDLDKVTWKNVKPDNANWQEHLVMGLFVR
ncbi:HlyD family efflux transporter periplasmic adaptor subunit [Gracilibacillus oryzae]|uniref:HlyD family efflux transporter periplasmic adaptor subunit n=1 Tax=Gracilibacillus oryzae TaxID=1672701 RepID=A0A7C8KXY4_9BACI|nr:efflux RND transporter periplasmic adaptor subunit [Gracilibacillus oryzae]KAB8129186.1 HlyD family efflux transporter periplasmic adaptor subunit [Gracilibacillus oryzae]